MYYASELFDVIENNSWDDNSDEFYEHSQVLECCVCGDYSEHEHSFLCEAICEDCKETVEHVLPASLVPLLVILVKKVREHDERIMLL